MAGAEYQLPSAWAGAIAGWLDWQKTGGSAKNTRSLRRGHVRYIAKISGTTHPRELTLNRLVDIFSEHDWSNEHRRGVRQSLINFCEYAVSQGLMDENPAQRLPRVAGTLPAPRPAPDEVWAQLIESAPPRELLIARLAGEAGLRRAEVAQLRLDDLIMDRGGWSLIVHGKGDKQRVVPITTSLAAAIREHCTHGYLFPAPDGGHLSPRWIGAMMSRLMPDGYTMHTLRHRFATRGYAGTGNLRAVQEALGHASVATTQRYTAVASDEVRAVAEAAGSGNDPAA